MISKEQVKTLIKTIKVNHKLTQAEISKKIGYEENTLTQLISKGENLDHAYNSLNLLLNGLGGLKNSTNDNYLKLLEDNDRFFKNEYAQMMLSLKELIALGRKQEALLKLNLQHIGAVEALQKGVEPEVVQEQINIQIADMGPSEEMDNDDYSHGKP
jgi:hypothetical protein